MDLRSALTGLFNRMCLLLILIAAMSGVVGWYTWNLVNSNWQKWKPLPGA
jgi:TRAP-type C4-dicarboxylate transport system permease small subunit